MPTQAATLKLIRQLHLYLGVFLSPALLFFAFTGALQTFSLHETTAGSAYKPPAWITTVAQLHKKQTTTVPVRKLKPQPDAAPAKPAAETPPPTPTAQKTHLPLKIFFLLVSIGLFTSTLTGLYMTWKFQRNRLVLATLLLAGIVVPLLLLPF